MAFLNLPGSLILISLPFSKQACFDADSILSSRVVSDGSILVILRFNSAIISFLETVMNFGRGTPRPSVISVYAWPVLYNNNIYR